MSDVSPEPNVEQVTVWRNLLDALGQLSSAWEGAVDAESGAARGEGPGAALPDDLVTAFALAGSRGAVALAGIADALAAQEHGEAFAEVAETQRHAQRAWYSARRETSGSSNEEPTTPTHEGEGDGTSTSQ